MDKNNEQLNKLARVFKADKIVSPEDIAEVLKGVLSIMNSFKSGNEKLNSQTKQSVESLLQKVLNEREGLKQEVSQATSEVKKELGDKIKEIKSLMKEVEEMKPADGMPGEDADEERVIAEVLKKIPTPKEVVLDDRQKIVEKINSGTDKDLKIQARQISDLPKFTREVIREVGAHGGAYETPLKNLATGGLLSKDSSGAYLIPSGTGTGGALTHNDVSNNSTTAAQSLYTGTPGVVTEFRGEKFTFTDNVNGAGAKNIVLSSPLAIGTNDVYLGNGYGTQPGSTFPVPYFRPVTSNSRLPFDLMPNTTGLAANTQLDVWMDICSYDFVNASGSQQEFMRVGYNSSAGLYGIIGTVAFNTGVVRPLAVNPYGGKVVVGRYGNIDDGSNGWLQVDGNTTGNSGMSIHSYAGSCAYNLYTAQGTQASPTAATTTNICYVLPRTYDGSAYQAGSLIKFVPTSTHSVSNRGMNYGLELTAAATTTRGVVHFASFTQQQFSDNGDAVAPSSGVSFSFKSTNGIGGLQLPLLTTTQKNALANVAGNTIYDSTIGNYAFNNGTTWNDFNNFKVGTATTTGQIQIVSSTNATAVLSNGGSWFPSATFAVPFLTPLVSGQTLNFDMFPHDTSAPTTNVYSSFFDIVDRDIASGGTAALSLARWAHFGINSNGFVVLDVNKGATATNIPLVIGASADATGIGFFGTNEVPLSFWPLQIRLATNSNFGFINRNDSTTASVTTAEMRAFQNASATSYIPMAFKSFSRIYNQLQLNVNMSLSATGSGGKLNLAAISDNNSTLIDLNLKANVIYVGVGTTTFTASGSIGGIIATQDEGNQFYCTYTGQNLNAGTTASTDIILGSNNATDTTNYSDFGINSSGNTDTLYTAMGAGTAYWYNQSQDLALGTAAAKSVKIFTGGTLAANIRMTVLGTGVGAVGIGTVTPTGQLEVAQTATATGALKGIVYTGAVNTNQTLSTEIPSLTITTAGRQWATGAISLQREVRITQPTYSFVGASTINAAVTLSIAGAPIASTNATLTNVYSVLVELASVGSGVTTGIGFACNATQGATNNYAAAFLNGQVLVGSTQHYNFDASSSPLSPTLQIIGNSAATAWAGIARWTASAASVPRFTLAKANSGTIGTFTAVAVSDSLGTFTFQGSDGTKFVESSFIDGLVDATVSAGVVPGRLILSTANASGVKTNAMTILSSQNIGLKTVSSPTAALHLPAGSASGSTAPLKFNSGTLLTGAEAGAMEFLTDLHYLTNTTGAIRRSIVVGNVGRVTAQTAAVASVATYTLGASDATFEVSMNILITTATLFSFTAELAYTDEGNTARTVTLNFTTLAGVISNAALTNAGGAVPYEGVPIHIRCKASTTITLRTQAAGTYTTVTFNAEGSIRQIG